jgi:transcriptional regulator
MYLPSHFKEDRPLELHALIRAHPFGCLVTHGANGLDANHVPFELAADDAGFGTLRAHVARSNPIVANGSDGSEVMVVFRGPQTYVSPSWYPSKHETHRQVPTWNYEVVHAHGTLRLVDDEKFVRGVVGRLTREHESGEARPWTMGDAPRDFIDQMLKAIVGVEISISRLEGKRKLSQNKEERDRRGVIATLEERGERAVSAAMKRTLPE